MSMRLIVTPGQGKKLIIGNSRAFEQIQAMKKLMDEGYALPFASRMARNSSGKGDT